MNVIFCSRQEAKKLILKNNSNTALLSISDDYEEMKEICDLSNFNPTFGLWFLDADDDSGITKDDCIMISMFVDRVFRSNKDIIVHCFAGVSRSAAVAKWICDHYSIENSALNGYTLYNKRVYNMLMDVTSGCVDINSTMFK